MIFHINNNQMMVLDQMIPNGKVKVTITSGNLAVSDTFVRFILPEEMVSLVNILQHARLNDLDVGMISTLVGEEIDRLNDFK